MNWVSLSEKKPEVLEYPSGRCISDRVVIFNIADGGMVVATLVKEVDGSEFWAANRAVGRLTYEYATHWLRIPNEPVPTCKSETDARIRQSFGARDPQQ